MQAGFLGLAGQRVLGCNLTPMDGVSDEDLVCRGCRCTVAYARDASGRAHAQEFLESADIPAKDKARLRNLFERMAETGHITNREHFKKERNKIWGFKSYQARVPAFQDERTWYLTHGFIKKRDDWPPTQLDRADRIREEHLTRQEKQRESRR
jgi:hypothetical protein